MTSGLWSIRCYTYWSSSLARGLTGAQVLSGPIYQHLAGVRVYVQPGDGVSSANFAPYNSRLPNGVLQLYVIEWVAQIQQWNYMAAQTIWDGQPTNTSTNYALTDILTTNNATMFLPASAVGSLIWRT
jgi:hypothetical protein